MSNNVVDVPADRVPEGKVQTEIRVIAGGPCSGKSTLLGELSQRGYTVKYEPAEELLRREVEGGQSARAVRSDPAEWQKKVTRADFDLFTGLDTEALVFTDTSLVETYVYNRYAKLQPGEHLEQFMRNFRFADVFFLEPLDLYETTDVRMEDQEMAEKLGQEILETYRQFNYEPHVIPPVSIENRLERILQELPATD